MSQQYKPGDTAYFDFTVSASTGALTNADSLPTAQVIHNGTIDGAVTVTVNAALATGIYSGSYTIPSGYAAGDDVRVLAKATVGGVAGGAIVDRYRLVGWSPGATIPADLQTIKAQTVTCSGGVTIPAATLASTTGAVGSVTARVKFDHTDPVPLSNTAQTVGDSLNAARAQGFGVMIIDKVAKTITLYGGDDTTPVRVFNVDDLFAPTQRS